MENTLELLKRVEACLQEAERSQTQPPVTLADRSDPIFRVNVVENGLLGNFALVVPNTASVNDLASSSTMPFGPVPHAGALQKKHMASELELEYLLNFDALSISSLHPVRKTVLYVARLTW